MRLRLFLCFFSCMIIALFTASAQTANPKGHIIVLQDSSIELLLRRNAAMNEVRQSMPGYRIQIYFGTDRSKASEIKAEFKKDHADIETYLVYHQPNFKVRVGDFKTRLEAVKAIQLISIYYPGAFIVKDEVKLPDLQ
jgi:hypothetical protein